MSIFASEGAIIIYLIIAILAIVTLVILINVSLTKKKTVERISESRFAMLTEIDKEYVNYEPKEPNLEIDLKDFCEGFRNYAASIHHLYYSIDDVRKFVANLAVSHIMILQGMSGTGKTSLAYAFGNYIKNDPVIVPVQPMWKERTDLIGYYNEFTKKFNETPFLKKLYEANYKNDMYITILDEMNIARIEYYFAEFLSLLEIPNPDGRWLEVVSDMWKNDPKKLENGMLKLPKNMWFIGTANNDDSTFSVSDKVYDRAMIMNLDKKALSFDADYKDIPHVSFDDFERMVNKANDSYKLSDSGLESIKLLDEYLQKHFYISFGNRIMKQIHQYVGAYVACGGTEIEALDDIIAKKIIRKLEGQNSNSLKKSKEDLINIVNSSFGENNMPITISSIERIVSNAK